MRERNFTLSVLSLENRLNVYYFPVYCAFGSWVVSLLLFSAEPIFKVISWVIYIVKLLSYGSGFDERAFLDC